MAYVPPHTREDTCFVTITNVLKDKRIKASQDFDYITTEDYRLKLNIPNNFVQIYLYLDINSSPV